MPKAPTAIAVEMSRKLLRPTAAEIEAAALQVDALAAKAMPPAKVTPFQRAVYAVCTLVPASNVATYSGVARVVQSWMATDPTAKPPVRAVGQALRRNPFAPTVPCHRVVAADGTLGGFFGETGGDAFAKKTAILRDEGAAVTGAGAKVRVAESSLLY